MFFIISENLQESSYAKAAYVAVDLHLWCSCGPAPSLKRNSSTRVFLCFLWILGNSQKHLFWKTSANGCLYFLLLLFYKFLRHVFYWDSFWNFVNIIDIGSFVKRQMSGTSSDNEWYNQWQQMTTSDNQWQRMTTRNKNNNEWQ